MGLGCLKESPHSLAAPLAMRKSAGCRKRALPRPLQLCDLALKRVRQLARERRALGAADAGRQLRARRGELLRGGGAAAGGAA